MFSTDRLPSSSLVPLRRNFLVPGPIGSCTLTASTSASEYPDPPGSAPPTVFANSLSIFIGPARRSAAGRNWLPVLRSAVPICPRTVDNGPRPARRAGALRAFSTENYFPPRRGPWKRANFALKFSSRDTLWKSKPRRLQVCWVCPTIIFYNAELHFFSTLLRIE